MLNCVMRSLLFVVSFLYAAGACAQQDGQPAQSTRGTITVDVVVTPKSGPSVTGLDQQDFAVLDNKVPQTLTSFQAVDGRQIPTEVILLVDAVNVDYQTVGFERTQIDRFLRANEGHLAYPTALAILTDTGPKMRDHFSLDGNELGDALNQYVISLQAITRSAGFWGGEERFRVSLDGLRVLAAHVGPHPARKIILAISPGWPLFSIRNIQPSEKDKQVTFDRIVDVSTQLLRARITLYDIDPLGVAAVGVQSSYWRNFQKGISKPGQAQPGALGLQVLAVQSGGLVLPISNDLSTRLQECLADIGAYYELSYKPVPVGQPREYHQIEIRVDKPGLTARTREGYYSQP